MPILPNGQRLTDFTIGGSPRGWTFISTAECWRRWALRYLVGLFPLVRKSYFDLGSAYHALMEGQPVEKVAAEFPEHISKALQLKMLRENGPPLGNATAVEQEYVLFGGLMTSKPDREERDVRGEGPPTRIRDYKTAMMFSENDGDSWNVDGGIIGEMLAAGVTKGIVDIVSKREKSDGSAPDKPVKLVDVTLTVDKVMALELLVRDFWAQLSKRLTEASKGEANRAFPPNLKACVGKYGACDYYDRCWGKAPESLMYKLAKEPPRKWVTGRETKPLKLPKGLSRTLIEKAAGTVRKAWKL